MNYNHKALGLKISKYREIKNLTQEQLAKLSGVSSGYISKLESGSGNSISFFKLAKLADVLNVEIDDLLCDSLDKLQNINNNENTDEINMIMDKLKAVPDEVLDLFYKSLITFINYKNKQ